MLEFRYKMVEESPNEEALDEYAQEFIDFYIEQFLYRRNKCPDCGDFLPEEYFQ